MPELLPDPTGCILAVYAHPDDCDVSCGGTLARWAGAGAEVHVIVCTRGDKGTTDPRVDPKSLADRRAKESEAASTVLGESGRHYLGYEDGEVADDRQLRSVLVGWIRKLRPRTVLCPDPTAVFFGEEYFNHRDHRAVGFAVLDSLSPASALPHYFPEQGPVHQVELVLLSGTLQPSVYVDITETIEQKLKAVSCHKSQLRGDADWAASAVRTRAEEEGRRAGVAHAEGFRRLRLGG